MKIMIKDDNQQDLKAEIDLIFCWLELDNFKNANDNYGHGAEDIVLAEVVERLKINTKSNDIVSRIGGDEFIIIIRDLKSSSIALEMTEKLVKVLSDAG